MPREQVELRGHSLGGFLRTRGDGDQLKFHVREITGMGIESQTRELASDAEALKVGVGAEVDVAAEHASADESDFDGAFHDQWRKPFGLRRCRQAFNLAFLDWRCGSDPGIANLKGRRHNRKPGGLRHDPCATLRFARRARRG